MIDIHVFASQEVSRRLLFWLVIFLTMDLRSKTAKSYVETPAELNYEDGENSVASFDTNTADIQGAVIREGSTVATPEGNMDLEKEIEIVRADVAQLEVEEERMAKLLELHDLQMKRKEISSRLKKKFVPKPPGKSRTWPPHPPRFSAGGNSPSEDEKSEQESRIQLQDLRQKKHLSKKVDRKVASLGVFQSSADSDTDSDSDSTKKHHKPSKVKSVKSLKVSEKDLTQRTGHMRSCSTRSFLSSVRNTRICLWKSLSRDTWPSFRNRISQGKRRKHVLSTSSI